MPSAGSRDAPAYRYQQIPALPLRFRIVKLLPTQVSGFPLLGFARSTLRIQIVEVDVDSDFSYDALSYSWNVSGSKPPDRRVIVETPEGQQDLRIFESLETALLHLAAAGKMRPLFVDQICINQKDDEEKAVQVQLMRNIYSSALRTIVWLGPGSRVSDAYFDFAQGLNEDGLMGRLMGPHVRHFPKVFSAVMDPDVPVSGVERQDRDDVLALLSSHGPRFPLDGLVDVLQRTWFGRLWIIQEACLAQSVTFVCGTRSLCFDCFRSGSLFYTIYNTHWVGRVSHSVSREELRRRNEIFALTKSFIRIFQERKAIHESGYRQSIYDLVLKYNVNDEEPKIGASLPEDRLFGVLGMASDIGPFHHVAVRYGETANVFTEFAGILVKHNLDVILFSQFPKSVDDLPSWVPDWSTHLRIPHGYTALTKPVFSAGGAIRGDGPLVDNSKHLIVQGLKIGRIEEVGKQNLQRDVDGAVLDQIDYRSLKRFYDEIDMFLDITHGHSEFPTSDNPERALTAMRLSDFGLSAKQSLTTLDLPGASELQQALYTQASKWGQRLIDTQRQVESFGISRMLEKVDNKPWYWAPPSEVDVLYLCALKPAVACQTWLRGASQLAIDILGLGISSALVQLYARFIRLRRRFTGVTFNARNRSRVLERVGLDPKLSAGPEMNAYTDYVYKNIGQRIYRTAQGHVGVVPDHAHTGDLIVILFGGSVPHVIRAVDDNSASANVPSGNYMYIGEAYCDGIMDGELLENADAGAETFRLL